MVRRRGGSGRLFLMIRRPPSSTQGWSSAASDVYKRQKGYFQSSLNHLYYVGRAFLVKSEAFYDMFDQAFQEYFGGIKTEGPELDKVLEWLENPLHRLPKMTPEEIAEFQQKLEAFKKEHNMDAVSYTHLTLPTIYSV